MHSMSAVLGQNVHSVSATIARISEILRQMPVRPRNGKSVSPVSYQSEVELAFSPLNRLPFLPKRGRTGIYLGDFENDFARRNHKARSIMFFYKRIAH